MSVPSDGSYGVPEGKIEKGMSWTSFSGLVFSFPGLVFSFPVTISDGEWTIVKGLELNEFAKEKIALTIEV